MTAPRVRIHGYLISTWTRTAHMTCIEKGIEHESVPVPYGTAEHGELHPFKRIPILEIDGTMIFESLAITGHLDEAFPGPALQPDSHAARVRMRMWMSLCSDYFFRDVVRGIPSDRSPSAEELATARAVLERAEDLVGAEPFLAGDALTLADLYLAPQLANCEAKAPELLEGLDALVTWARRMSERESFQRTRPPARSPSRPRS
jgi:glutathione S-transferase